MLTSAPQIFTYSSNWTFVIITHEHCSKLSLEISDSGFWPVLNFQDCKFEYRCIVLEFFIIYLAAEYAIKAGQMGTQD